MEGRLLLLFFILSVVAAASRERCLPGCECGPTSTKGKGSQPRYGVITCDTFPRTSLPPGVSTFRAKQSPNRLTRNSFSPLKPSYITTLDLCESGIESLADNTFSGIQTLAILKLSLNKIKTLTSNAFLGCNQLLSIYLDGNGLTSLGPNCFTGLTKLTNLYIQHNNIKFIPPLPPSISALDASYNLIGPEINDYVFQENIKYVDLCGNPITSVEASCFSKTALQSLCTPGRLEPQHNGSGYVMNLNNITLVANPPGSDLPPHLIQQLVNMEDLQHIKIISYNISSMEFLNSKILLTLVLEHVSATSQAQKELIEALLIQNKLATLSLAYSPQLASTLTHHETIWQHVTWLTNLDVRGCNLQSLHNIQGHGIPMYIDLTDNPLHCDCKLLEALGTDLLLSEDNGPAICKTPQVHKDEPLVNVQAEVCKGSDKKTNPKENIGRIPPRTFGKQPPTTIDNGGTNVNVGHPNTDFGDNNGREAVVSTGSSQPHEGGDEEYEEETTVSGEANFPSGSIDYGQPSPEHPNNDHNPPTDEHHTNNPPEHPSSEDHNNNEHQGNPPPEEHPNNAHYENTPPSNTPHNNYDETSTLGNGHFSFPDSSEHETGDSTPTDYHPHGEHSDNPDSQGHHHTTTEHHKFEEFDDKYNEHHTEGESKKTLVLTILGVVIAIAVIAAIVFTGLFFYFRRRGHVGIEGAAHAQYNRNHGSSKDNLVK